MLLQRASRSFHNRLGVHTFKLSLGLFLLLAIWPLRGPALDLLVLLRAGEITGETLRGYGAWGPIVFAALQILQIIVAFIPGHALPIVAGYVYGFAGGFALALITGVAASQLAFAIARLYGRSTVRRLVPNQALRRYENLARRYGFALFAISFMVPLLPGDVMNFVAGLSPISGRRFLLANVIGRLPSMALMASFGAHGLRLEAVDWVILAAIASAALVALRAGWIRPDPDPGSGRNLHPAV